MIKASCHCGAVKLNVPTPPENISVCNCSVCTKIGGLWAYYNPANVTIKCPRSAIDTYIWGDKSIQFCRCKTCGCTTHWESIDPEYTERMGINARMMTGLSLDQIPVRHVDGASY